MSLDDDPLKATLNAYLDQWVARGRQALAEGHEVTTDALVALIAKGKDLSNPTPDMFGAQLIINAVLLEREIKRAPTEVHP